jgi:ribonucleotide reductase alpha subunit
MIFNNLKDAFSLRNPCGEFVSDTDSDSCNLGTIFISKFKSRDAFEECVKYATKFLVCGNLYSDYPTKEMKEVALKNNRIGLGLGGIHEWLINRNEPYSVPVELHKWLNVYERASDEAAYIFAKDQNIVVPLSKRAIAPTGTIGALSESTTGIEPIFCKAYKRSYLKDNKKVYEYVIDGTIKRLMVSKVPLNQIQDSYDILLKDRLKVQADVQQYVDQAISSTVNIPEWGSENNNESTIKKYSDTILRYAKRLRGITLYPNNSRGGQPLQRVDIEEAIKQEGQVFEYHENSCSGETCGI